MRLLHGVVPGWAGSLNTQNARSQQRKKDAAVQSIQRWPIGLVPFLSSNSLVKNSCMSAYIPPVVENTSRVNNECLVSHILCTSSNSHAYNSTWQCPCWKWKQQVVWRLSRPGTPTWIASPKVIIHSYVKSGTIWWIRRCDLGSPLSVVEVFESDLSLVDHCSTFFVTNSSVYSWVPRGAPRLGRPSEVMC